MGRGARRRSALQAQEKAVVRSLTAPRNSAIVLPAREETREDSSRDGASRQTDYLSSYWAGPVQSLITKMANGRLTLDDVEPYLWSDKALETSPTAGAFCDVLASFLDANGVEGIAWPQDPRTFRPPRVSLVERRKLAIWALLSRVDTCEALAQQITTRLHALSFPRDRLIREIYHMDKHPLQGYPERTLRSLEQWASAFLQSQLNADRLAKGQTPVVLTSSGGSLRFAHWLVHPCGGRDQKLTQFPFLEGSPAEVAEALTESVSEVQERRLKQELTRNERRLQQQIEAHQWAETLVRTIASGELPDAQDLGVVKRIRVNGRYIDTELPLTHEEALREAVLHSPVPIGPFPITDRYLGLRAIETLVVGGCQPDTGDRLREIRDLSTEELGKLVKTPYKAEYLAPGERPSDHYLRSRQDRFVWLFACGEYLHRELANCPPNSGRADLNQLARISPCPYAIWSLHPEGAQSLPEGERPPNRTWGEARTWIERSTPTLRRDSNYVPRPKKFRTVAAPLMLSTNSIFSPVDSALDKLGIDLRRINVKKLAEAPIEQQRAEYEGLKRIVLFGGPDVPRAWYRDRLKSSEADAPKEPEAEVKESARDKIERTFAAWALAEKKPIGAICRGMQLLNVAAGGTLQQDVKELVADSEAAVHLNGWHRVRIDPHSALAARIRRAREVNAEKDASAPVSDPNQPLEITVVSRHHQCIRDVAPGFRPVAWSEDGKIIEAIEHVEHPDLWWGVQFHPERFLENAPSLTITRDLLGLDGDATEDKDGQKSAAAP